MQLGGDSISAWTGMVSPIFMQLMLRLLVMLDVPVGVTVELEKSLLHWEQQKKRSGL